jgi:ABC-type transport system involved in cytochrome bd biosynthesis fused ATPase/permease subunit
MQTQQREHKMPSWARVVFAIVGIILILAGTTIGIIQGTLFNTVSVVLAALGAAFALCQWLLPLSSNAPQPTTVPAPISVVPQIIVQVPTVQLPPQVVASYRGIVSIHPPTDPQTIQQREKAVEEIYTELLQPNITAIVLTGIGGVGKSTLAALVYDYTEKNYVGNLSLMRFSSRVAR